MERHGPLGIATAQCAALLVIMPALAFSPPATGAMLVVPLGTATQGDLVSVTVRHGGSVLGPGPTPGSLIVYGARASLRPALWGVHALLLAAPSPICGASAALPAAKIAA